jgi:phosphatidylinositol-3-phosphatase
MEDMDARPGVRRTTCQGPYTKTLIENPVPAGNPKTPDDYRAKHNPFVYFHSIFDDLAYCDARDVPLTGLAADLQSEATTPNFSFIVPNQCNDAHDFPTCSDGSMGGLQRANDWLKIWIPRIKASPAYKHDGLIIITFDEALYPSSCCGEKKGPNLGPNENNGGSYGPLTPLATGGGVTGAIFLSKYIVPKTVSRFAYNHYSYLKSMEKLFGLPLLGYAAQDGLRPFGGDIYSNF